MKPTLLFLITAAFLFSCKKHRNDDGTTGNLLVSTVTGAGTNNYGYTYTYNNSNKLTALEYTSKWNGVNESYQMYITRNSQGIIQTYRFNGADPFTKVENLNYKMNFDTSIARYTSAIGTFLLNGAPGTDSVTYQYNALGQIIKTEIFRLNSGNYVKLRQRDYTYDNNGNLTNSKRYTYNTGTDAYVLSDEYTFEYDRKVNPLRTDTEAVITGYLESASVNNVTKSMYVHHTNPGRNVTLSMVYTYNNDDKPLTAAITFPNTSTLTTTYKYK